MNDREYEAKDAETIVPSDELRPQTPEEIALIFAKRRHSGQFYGVHPYMFHIGQVVRNARRILGELPKHISDKSGFGEELIVSAYLHDTVEDGVSTVGEIRAVFGEATADHIDRLTKRRDENYYEYLMRLVDPGDGVYRSDKTLVPLLVKLADARANLDNSIIEASEPDTNSVKTYMFARKRIEKYQFAIYLVTNELYHQHDIDFGSQ